MAQRPTRSPVPEDFQILEHPLSRGPEYGQPILGVTKAKTSTATSEDRRGYCSYGAGTLKNIPWCQRRYTAIRLPNIHLVA
jgi:hypothetical protein